MSYGVSVCDEFIHIAVYFRKQYIQASVVKVNALSFPFLRALKMASGLSGKRLVA